MVDAFRDDLNRAHGQYPELSVNQLREFLSTIIRVTSMEEDDFTKIQKEKVRLLSEYREEIDDLLKAANDLRQRSIEDWPERFRRQVDEQLWADGWLTRDDFGENGCIFREGWYLDNENLEPTTGYAETQDNTGFRLHFNHLIRKEESFTEGELTYRLRCPTRVQMRDEFHSLYNKERWQEKLDPILQERGISNKGQKRDYMQKTYDVDQSGLPESYFKTLALAFEEHIPVAKVLDDIVDEALEKVKEG